MRWTLLGLVAMGCITGRGLSDDEQFPEAGDDAGDDDDTLYTSATTVPLAVVEGDVDAPCGDSAASLTARGSRGRIAITHEGAEMGDCTTWSPAASLDGDVITLEYLPDDGVGNCSDTCPRDFSFSIEVGAGDYVVQWHDQEAAVTVD